MDLLGRQGDSTDDGENFVRNYPSVLTKLGQDFTQRVQPLPPGLAAVMDRTISPALWSAIIRGRYDRVVTPCPDLAAYLTQQKIPACAWTEVLRGQTRNCLREGSLESMPGPGRGCGPALRRRPAVLDFL